MTDGVRRWSLAGGATLFVAVVAEALHYTRGHYKTNRVLFVALALLGLALARPAAEAADRRHRHLALLALLGTGLMVRDPRLLYATAEAQETLRYLAGLAAFAAVGLVFFAFRPTSPPGRRVGLATLALCALVVMRPVVLWGSPAPHIDVFTTLDRAAGALLAGANPYSLAYADIYDGRYDYAAGVAYWPGTVVFTSLSKLVCGDLRGAMLLAELASAALVARVVGRGAGQGAGQGTGLVAAVAVLAFPVGPFVLEQAWVDPLILAWFLGAVALLGRARWGWAGACVGVAVATKQPAALGAVLIGGVLLARDRRAALRLGLAAAAAFSALVLPFVLWDAAGLYRMTLQVPLSQAMRTDALTLVALLAREAGVTWPGALSALLYVATLVALGVGLRRRQDGLRPERLLTALGLLYGVVFLFGKQAFANYWAFAALLVLAGRAVAPVAPAASDPGLAEPGPA